MTDQGKMFRFRQCVYMPAVAGLLALCGTVLAAEPVVYPAFTDRAVAPDANPQSFDPRINLVAESSYLEEVSAALKLPDRFVEPSVDASAPSVAVRIVFQLWTLPPIVVERVSVNDSSPRSDMGAAARRCCEWRYRRQLLMRDHSGTACTSRLLHIHAVDAT